MKVLQILPELKSGGVERGTVDLAKYLLRHGHQAIVVSAGGPLVGDLTAAGVTHYTLPVHRKSPFSVYYSARVLAKIVRKEKVDILHARSRVPALVALLVSRRTQVPFITTCHGFYNKHPLSKPMGWGKLVIVASNIIGKRMRDDFGVPHEKIRLIPRGVNLEEFKLRQNPTGNGNGKVIVGLVGRLTPIKGHSLFLKAMARVARVIPNLQIQIIGDAPKPQYKEELLTLTRNLGLEHAVEFLGTRYDIPELLSRMDVLVAPSVGEEAFGRVVIEAGACGVPVVATRMGGLVDVVENEKDGLLVGPDDPRILADAVLRLLKDTEYAQKLARSLRKKVETEFTLEKMFDRTLKIYGEALARRRILVIKLSAIGDVILSVPSLRALRLKFPDAWISVLVGRKSRALLRNCPYVNDVIAYEGSGNGISSVARMTKLLSKEGFDTVVDLQNNRTSHLLSYLSGASIRVGHGSRRWSFLLSRRAQPAGTDLAPLDHQLQVLQLLGIESIERRLELWTEKEDARKVNAFLESQWVSPSQVLVGINPGSSLRWPTKQWPVENFAKLCDELARRNVRVVITGSELEAPLVEELMSLTRNKPVNAVGKTTIPELIALVRRCQVFVSSDSAPMHIAASSTVPLVALFGPTDAKRHLVPPERYQVFQKEVPCGPCYLRNCPVGLVCMKKIGVQEILDSVLHFLNEKRPARAMMQETASE